MKKIAACIFTVILIFSFLIYVSSIYVYDYSPARPNEPIFLSNAAKGVEVLWLARAINSETKRPNEQKYIAWVIKNRVLSGYRGNYTYRETVLDPYQFSAFNKENPDRNKILSKSASELTREIKIANRVISSNSRPIPKDVLHFWSPRSMSRKPNWACSVNEFNVEGINKNRFRFYQNIK